MRDLSEIRGILFDKDGTLIDFNRTWFGVVMALARAARPGDENGARDLVALGGYDWAAQRFRSGSAVAAGTNADIVDVFYPDLVGEDRTARIADFNAFTTIEGARRAVAIPGLAPALEHLSASGLLLGIATNDSEAGARATAGALGLSGLFHSIIGYDSVTQPKPWPDQLELFAARTGLPARAIAMVGDNTHDLDMAHAAGAGLAIGVLSGNSTRGELEARADIIIDSIADLPALLSGD
ncbi:HAD family hydrolase [Devosia sp. FKR38]|uniref:HAD family hydrolase n=1 Tax=Devosia sp. FKR38 TaxID=2562312 RepID=UPI0010C077F1|nr:HAD family hydrolase [Devosia sp. FKR38]